MPTFRAVAERGAAWTGAQFSRATAQVWTLLSPKVQGTQAPHGGKRWQLTALPPKASPPPSPLLPSEIKYSASLVRGQAVVHSVLGVILFTFGVLGSHRWASTTCVPGLVCGVAGVAAGVCGGLAHKIWYKNWAIKSFLVSSAAVVILSLLALTLTFYFTLSSASAYEAHAQYESFMLERLRSQDGEQEQEEIIGTFFEVPTPPPSKSLVGNMVVGLVLQLLVSMWAVLTAWRGVRAHEFTPRRREELLKQIMAAAPARKGQVDAEEVNAMPLAALYQLLQTHPELLQGAVPHQEQPQRPASRHSMDYRERVCRYLSKAHEADPITTQGNGSPTPCHSSTKRSVKPSPTGAATDTKMAATQSKESIKFQSRERLGTPALSEKCQSSNISPSTSSSSSSPVHFPKFGGSSDRTSSSSREGNEAPTLEKLSPSKESSEVENSSDFKALSVEEKVSDCKEASDAEKSGKIKSSSVEKSCDCKEASDTEKSCKIKASSVEKSSENSAPSDDKSPQIKDATDSEEAGDDKMTNHTQSQSLVLGLKTLPPLSTHLIKPSDLVPKRATQQMRRSSVGSKLPSPLHGDSEYNVTFRNTLDRPPPVPRKEFGKPKLVLNADVHRMLARSEKQINGRPRQSRSVSDLGDAKRNWNVNELSYKDRPRKGPNKGKIQQSNSSVKDQCLKTKVSSQPEVTALISSTRSRSSNPPRIQKKKKDRKPPPIPIAKECLVQGPVNSSEDASERKFPIEVDTSNKVDVNDDTLSTAVNSGSISAHQNGHLEHDGPCAEAATQRELSFTESHSLAMVHGSEVAAPRSAPSSDSGVSSVVGSDDNISTDDASPPESHVSIDEEIKVDKQASNSEISFNRDKVTTDEVLSCQKSATSAELCPLKKGSINEEFEREKNVTAENVSHSENSDTSEVNTCVSYVCDSEVGFRASSSETTLQNEDVKKCLTEFKDSTSEAVAVNNARAYSSVKASLHPPTELENTIVSEICSNNVNDSEGSKAREVPFVKSVILKNKDWTPEGVRANENRKQTADLITESLQGLENFSRTTTGPTKSSGATSLPVMSSKDVKISFRSLKDETSIPTSFGSIKNNKSFEQILGAILSKAHNLTTSKQSSFSDSKNSAKLPRSRTFGNAENIRDSHQSQGQEKQEKVTEKEPSRNMPTKSLTIEIRPYECRSIREEINSLKN